MNTTLIQSDYNCKIKTMRRNIWAKDRKMDVISDGYTSDWGIKNNRCSYMEVYHLFGDRRFGHLAFHLVQYNTIPWVWEGIVFVVLYIA